MSRSQQKHARRSGTRQKQKGGDPRRKNGDQTPLWREVWGWIFVLSAGIALASLVLDFALHDQAHPFGPYLGRLTSRFLLTGLGRLPALFLLPWLALAGIKMIRFQHLSVSWKILGVTAVLWLELVWFLSLRHFGTEGSPAPELLEAGGGLFGAFLIRFAGEPLFGSSSTGAWIAGFFALVLTLILGVGWRPSVWVDRLVERWRSRRRRKEALVTDEEISGLVESQAERLIREKREKQSAAAVEAAALPPSAAERPEFPLDRYSKEEMDAMDPRELRRLLEEASEWNLASAQVQWEQSHDRSIKFGGLAEAVSPSGTPGDEFPIPSEELPLSVPRTIASEGVGDRGAFPEEEETRSLEIVAAVRPTGGSVTGIPVPVPQPGDEPYRIPDIRSLLPEPPEQKVDFTQSELEQLSRVIELQLANFKVKGKCVGVTAGPVITRFEVELAPGTAVSKVGRLDNDLAMALRARAIRIIAPIPGTNHVGIEVPNKKRQVVYYRKMLSNPGWAPDHFALPIALGQDISGKEVVIDLTRAPHLLIAGSTGSGKSVCINTLMASILATKTPDEVRMLLVDPKVVELKLYENIPHLSYPVITTPEEAVQMLQWACEEMDRRYVILSQAKVRNLAGFNEKFRAGELDEVEQPEDRRLMPMLVIVIDELADLMMVAGKEVEKSIARIAQKARAVGIHLVLATQRPDSKVITGLIKANLPSRIAFRVAQQIDSRIILDRGGAEKLLGMGDMLYLPGNAPEPERVHGCFLSDNDVEIITEAVGSQKVNYPMIESLAQEVEEEQEEERGPLDPLFVEVAEYALHSGGLSTSHVQRRFSLGYSRAGRIVDQLERFGIVGPVQGAKPRALLVDEHQLRNILAGQEGDRR